MSSDVVRRTVRRMVALAGLVGGVWLAAASPALAHGDSPLVDRTVPIRAGGSVAFSGDLHYHRLVGRFSSDLPVIVRLVDPANGTVAVERGPATEIAINELVACCDDATWTSYELVIANTANQPVAVRVTARLVHDDLAIMVHGAEPGTEQSVVWFAAIMSAALWFGLRRKRPLPLRRAATPVVVLVAAVLVAEGYGVARYGHAGAGSLLAAGYDLSALPANRLLSRTTLVLSLMLVAWIWINVRWARARADAPPLAWAGLGAALIGVVACTALVAGFTYRAWGIPLALAAAFALPVVVVLVWSLLRMRTDPVGPASSVAAGQ